MFHRYKQSFNGTLDYFSIPIYEHRFFTAQFLKDRISMSPVGQPAHKKHVYLYTIGYVISHEGGTYYFPFNICLSTELGMISFCYCISF